MPEANAEQGRFRLRRPFDEIEANAGLVRRAGSRRQHDMRRLERHRFGCRQCVVTAHIDLRPQFAEIMREVVDEAVVVIDQKQHGENNV